jgi:alcohol dehydrogenase (cytochrome c)
MAVRGALALMVLVAAASLQAQVTFDRLLRTDREPHNWLTYSGNVLGQRYSPLTQITTGNVRNLELQWVWQAKSLEKYETTSLVVDGVLYTIQAPNNTNNTDGNTQVVALDAATGRQFWTFRYDLPYATSRTCCGRVNRGLAILGDTLYMGTLNSHLIAINAKVGKLVWDTTVTTTPGYPITHAPLIVKDKVIVGTGGGDGAIRGFIAAFDAKTGKEVWRFYTIPGPGEPGNDTWLGDSWKQGGTGIWNIGAYDAETNLTFWGTGNPNPTGNGDIRLGDNLYSDSVIALDADTGALKWHYQFTPHDRMDYDATQVPVLADIEFRGRMRKVMLWANRNGLMYVLDRVTGEFLIRREGPSAARPGQASRRSRRRHADHAHGAWRHQLVPAILQPEDRVVLRVGLGEHQPRRPGPDRGQQHAHGRHRARPQREERRRRVRRRPGVRSENARAEVGIQNGRHHLGRRALDGR